jgi:glycosyltransferase involved in cell wall biosynthesis
MKILLLSDNVNNLSGISRVSRDMIKYSSKDIEWIQLSGASDMNLYKSSPIITQIGDNKVKMYPCHNYGNPNLLRHIINQESPDIILHFTDPRFWIWLYEMEFEIRKLLKVPIAYYSIWDNYPIPKFNAPYYNSCDLLIAINSVANKVHKELAPNVHSTMVMHGVDAEIFKPLSKEEISEVKNNFLEQHNCERILFWNNVNMRRKNPLQLMEAFAEYYRKYDNKCCLVLHTNPADEVGANLITVKRHLFDDVNIVFSVNKLDEETMNLWYNISDAVISISSNEGFGLSIQEAAAANCRSIVLKTGGLEMQGHKYNAILIEPDLKLLSGSQLVPYIYQDYASTESIVKALKAWRNTVNFSKFQIYKKVFTAKDMTNRIVEELKLCVSKFNTNSKLFTITDI